MHLTNLATGLPQAIRTAKGKELLTGICKQGVTEAQLTENGFQHDDVADKKHHGGPDRAVCVYPAEHYSQWNEQFSCELPAAAFGENLTVSGMTEADVCIGDIYRIGDVRIQVTQGRIPCSTIDQRLGYPVMKAMIETGHTGYLCRVLEEGLVREDSVISLEQRDPSGVSVLEANTIYFHQPSDIEGIRQVLAIDALADEWRRKFEKLQEKASANS